jgi:serine/threonine-protein kinase
MLPLEPPVDPRLEDLLDRWDELRGQGQAPSPDELTQDPDLLPGLERLVADLLLAEAALGGGPPPAASPAQGVPGRYEAPKYHAEGGMGVVYRAHDRELGREIAYKVIKPSLSSDRRAVEKFLHEARVTARLQHPGVLPVFGLSTDAAGRPAYAMRFAEGTDLFTVVESFHATHSAVPSSRSAWQGILNHFVRVCQTVAYAHAQGIIHRDLAPGNVLLVGDGETLVIDWGLASESPRTPEEDTFAQAAPTRAGTAPFTAPEVWDAEQPFGPLSDIYSLGALLYLILTGRAPYSGTTTAAVVAQLREGPPPGVERMCPGVPRPLTRICSKAMSRQPSIRYASAQELGREIESWLAGERVAADREPWRETAWRWAGRHRALIGTSAALLLAIAVGMPIAYVRERLWREEAEAASERAERARQTAEAEQQRANRLTEEIITQAETVGSTQATFPAAKAVLDHSAHYLEELARDAAADPMRRAAVADYYVRAGRIRFKLNQLPEAAASFAQARSLGEALVQEDPENPAHRHRWAASLREWGVSQIVQGRSEQAASAWKQAAELLEPLADKDLTYKHTLAKTFLVLGNLAMYTGKAQESHEAFARGRTLAAQLVRAVPGEAAYRFTLADLWNNEGYLLFQEAGGDEGPVKAPKKLQEAQAAHREALRLRRALVEAEPGNPEFKAYLAASLNNLGNALLAQGEKGFAEAEAKYQEALAFLEPLALAFPGVPSHRQETAQVFSNLNRLLELQKRWAEAETYGRRAVEHFALLAQAYPTVPEHSQELGVALERLASTLRHRGRPDPGGEQEFAAALAFARASAGQQEAGQREALAARAVGLLERSRREGYFTDTRRIERLEREPALEGLRQRPDYRQLLAAVRPR